MGFGKIARLGESVVSASRNSLCEILSVLYVSAVMGKLRNTHQDSLQCFLNVLEIPETAETREHVEDSQRVSESTAI